MDVLLKELIDVDDSITELLFANPADDDTLVGCATELLFDTCGRYDDAIEEFA